MIVIAQIFYRLYKLRYISFSTVPIDEKLVAKLGPYEATFFTIVNKVGYLTVFNSIQSEKRQSNNRLSMVLYLVSL